MSCLHEVQTISKSPHILPMPSLTRLTTGGVLNPLKNTTNTSHNELLHQDPLQPPPEPRFPFVAPLYPALRSLEVAGGGLRKRGIRGAGSVVRYALSFGRHSRQPFGRGLAPRRPLPHPLVATLLGALTVPAPLRSTGLPSTAPPGLFRVPHCASVSDACVMAQTAVCAIGASCVPLKQQVLSCQFPIAYAVSTTNKR